MLSVKENREPEPFVLIIDEINRGNVAKIFGEMITLLEEDKRWSPASGKGLGIPLIYDEKDAKPFSLPVNLYVIGTMNSSDRSVQKLDSALRRRFNFEAEDPDPAKLSEGLSGLREFLAALNDRLEKLRPGSGCQVGHAWFMRAGLPLKEPLSIIDALNEKVFPLLQEWFWDSDDTLRQLLQVRSEDGKRKNSEHISAKGRLRFDGKAEDLAGFLRSFSA
jgi:5-methylcytosine-specific restriction protein B